jgi:hypothetical protein
MHAGRGGDVGGPRVLAVPVVQQRPGLAEPVRRPAIPGQTTFAGPGTMAQTIAYRTGEPAPHFIFDVQPGRLRVENNSGGRWSPAAGSRRARCRHAA